VSAGFRFECSFDGVPFDCMSQRVSHGRRVPVHENASQDGAYTEDSARKPRRISMEIVFIDHRYIAKEAGDVFARFDAFDALAGTGKVRQLVHPYLGVINCRLEDFDHSSDAESDPPAITLSVTFVEDLHSPAVLDAAAANRPVASAQEAQLEIDEAGLSAPALTLAAEEVVEWETNTALTPREVQMRMGDLSNRLDQELSDFEALTDIESYPIVKAYVRLQYQLRNLAQAVTSTSGRTMRLTVTEPIPLRILAARFYSPKESDQRFREMLDLNPGLSDPHLVPRGTELKVAAP
jgi:prophage DNA circulation protein